VLSKNPRRDASLDGSLDFGEGISLSKLFANASYPKGDKAIRNTSWRPLYAASTISLSSNIALKRRLLLCLMNMNRKLS